MPSASTTCPSRIALPAPCSPSGARPVGACAGAHGGGGAPAAGNRGAGARGGGGGGTAGRQRRKCSSRRAAGGSGGGRQRAAAAGSHGRGVIGFPVLGSVFHYKLLPELDVMQLPMNSLSRRGLFNAHRPSSAVRPAAHRLLCTSAAGILTDMMLLASHQY